jgi:hypothetical protein
LKPRGVVDEARRDVIAQAHELIERQILMPVPFMSEYSVLTP